MEKNYTVYVHIFPNGKKYVGITCQKLERRWRNGHGYSANIRLTRAFQKYGWESIRHEVLASGLSMTEAENMEKTLISDWDLLNTNKGYNLARGGTHPKHTEETKKKISEAKKGRSPSINKGKFGGDHPAAKPIVAINIKTGDREKMFSSIVEAAEKMNISKSCLQAALHGHQKTSHGYKWEYVEL